MITFTDLVALMLAFFVLLFAMSRVEQTKWQGLVDSLATDLNALKQVETITPALEYHPEDEAVVPGVDLDYLAPVLRQQIAAHALLASGTVRGMPDRLVVSLPAELLYQANGTTLAPRAREVGFALGGLLRNLINRIEVVAHVAPPDRAQGRHSDWQLALARAALFTDMLTRAGYQGPIVARGVAESRAAGQAIKSNGKLGWLQGDRLDIVIHERVQEP
jgi:chemotaxis protein MotB